LTTYFPDINVWVALSVERHVFCPAAKSWFSSLHDEELNFCRVTQMGFLRLLTNPHVMKDEVMNPGEAWQAYRLLRSDERINYAAEPKELSEEWAIFTEGKKISPNLWTDAYLCAFAQSAGLILVTFDANIPVRHNVQLLVLKGIS
jgi:uncharacterized protein